MTEEMLEVLRFHQAMLDHDGLGPNAERCILPMRGPSYAKSANFEDALKHFRRFPELRPGDVEVKWLLNLTYMTLGRYPGAVPAEQEQLLPPLLDTSERLPEMVDWRRRRAWPGSSPRGA